MNAPDFAVIALFMAGAAGAGAQVDKPTAKPAFSSFDLPSGAAGERQFEARALKLEGVDLTNVLALYEKVSARTVIRGAGLPQVKLSLRNQTPLNRVETLQLLDTLLAANGVTMVLAGDSAVKAVPSAKATNETAPLITLPADQLPESSSYMSRTVPLEKVGIPLDQRAQAQIMDVLRRCGRLPRSVTLDTNGHQLVLRDYSANIRRMLYLIGQFNPKTDLTHVVIVPNRSLRTVSSFDAPTGPAGEPQFAAGELKLNEADLPAILELYQKVSSRTVIPAAFFPPMKFNLYNQAPLNRVETLRALDTALAQKGVTMVQVGDNSVIATDKPGLEVAPAVNSPTDQLPESSSYMLTTVHLKKADPDLVVRTLATASQLPGSVIYMPSANLLILRDYSSGIRRMLRYLQESDP